MLKDTAPVHVIDTRAQADALIMGALEELQVLDVCAEQGVRLTFFLFPTDDTESMTNAGRLFFYAGDRVDYVHRPQSRQGAGRFVQRFATGKTIGWNSARNP